MNFIFIYDFFKSFLKETEKMFYILQTYFLYHLNITIQSEKTLNNGNLMSNKWKICSQKVNIKIFILPSS